jgi:hypothetical protein
MAQQVPFLSPKRQRSHCATNVLMRLAVIEFHWRMLNCLAIQRLCNQLYHSMAGYVTFVAVNPVTTVKGTSLLGGFVPLSGVPYAGRKILLPKKLCEASTGDELRRTYCAIGQLTNPIDYTENRRNVSVTIKQHAFLSDRIPFCFSRLLSRFECQGHVKLFYVFDSVHSSL